MNLLEDLLKQWPHIIGLSSLGLYTRGWVIRYVTKHINEDRATAVGMKFLLRKELDELLTKSENKGHITPEDFDLLESIFNAYKNLGGNGQIEMRWENVKHTVERKN